MFAVDEPTAEAIRRAFIEGGELSGIVEFQRHFPLISDYANARMCVRVIAGWKPLRAGKQSQGRAHPERTEREGRLTLR